MCKLNKRQMFVNVISTKQYNNDNSNNNCNSNNNKSDKTLLIIKYQAFQLYKNLILVIFIYRNEWNNKCNIYIIEKPV